MSAVNGVTIHVGLFIVFLQHEVAPFIHCPACTTAGNVVDCFDTSQTCAGSQICFGTMENFRVSVECGFEQDCQAELLFDKTNCMAGRPFHPTDRCHFCCHDLESCRQAMDVVQEGIDAATEVLHCPTCPEGTTNPLECLSDLQPCDPGVKVCSIEWTATRVKAGCEANAVLCHLQEGNSQEACVEEGLREDAFCTRCCTDQACWLAALYLTTTLPPTTIPLTTTATIAVTTSPPTTATTTTTTLPPPTTSPELPCINHVIYDYHCNTLPAICAGPGAKACQRLCGLCNYTGSTEPPQQRPTASCYDRVGNDLTCADLPGVCDDDVTQHLLCPRFCNACASTTTTTTTTTHNTHPAHTTTHATAVCRDNLVGSHCADMVTQGVCQDHLAVIMCPRTCGYCT